MKLLAVNNKHVLYIFFCYSDISTTSPYLLIITHQIFCLWHVFSLHLNLHPHPESSNIFLPLWSKHGESNMLKTNQFIVATHCLITRQQGALSCPLNRSELLWRISEMLGREPWIHYCVFTKRFAYWGMVFFVCQRASIHLSLFFFFLFQPRKASQIT